MASYSNVIPKIPELRKKTYSIPESYAEAYRSKGITCLGEQVVLFHLTQFGGFRVRKKGGRPDVSENFLDGWCNQKSVRGARVYKPNGRFLKDFGHINLSPLERKWRLEAVSYDQMVEQGFSDDEIDVANRFMNDLNGFYSSLRLDLNFPSSGLALEDRLIIPRFNSVPFMVMRPKAGCRLFHPGGSYQRLGSSLRELMTIDGEPTSEVDLSAAVLQFLDLASGGRSGINFEEGSDPYGYFIDGINCWRFKEMWDGDITRDEVKDLLYTAIFSDGRQQETLINRKLKMGGGEGDETELKAIFPDFFRALEDIKDDEGLPPHQEIFMREAKYAMSILRSGCLNEGIPILPIHDSFITTRGNRQRLIEIMDETSERLYDGRRLTHKVKY